MLNIIGLILARGGSKRIPSKNIKKLGGKPLIAWSIETALYSKAFTKVIVSTDSTEIANISLNYGAEVPWLRPPKLSTDESLSIDAVLHATDWMTDQALNVDGVMLLQPTLPFRTANTILSAIELFEKNNFKPVVSFNEVDFFPEWCFRKDGSQLLPILSWDAIKKRSQDIKPTLQINGLVYLASPQYLVKNLNFIGPTTIPLVSKNTYESIDIDTYEDWQMAEQIVKRKQ
jgi:N-acylneuraminate cytidylyltransferase/CMP-N,N'-diacetyllegionaminic acid synthase